jgi:glutathione peroxidase
MHTRRKFLKWIYPLTIRINKWTGNYREIFVSDKQAIMPFHHLSMEKLLGGMLDFGSLSGKKVLIVNTASDCVFTSQYSALQELQDSVSDKLQIIGFPSGDFREQEMESMEEISSFCQGYGVSFPLMKKSIVRKKTGQNDIFKWLTHSDKNGWNDRSPGWNFNKYLVDEMGDLIAVFGSSIEPQEIRAYL